MPGKHDKPPIAFRPPKDRREWLTGFAAQTGRPVNAILTEAVADKEREVTAQQTDDVIRAKWLLDDSATLREAAEKLRAEADRLEELHKEGWTLAGPVKDDYGFLVPPEKA